MKPIHRSGHGRRRVTVAVTAVLLTLSMIGIATASHPEASLPGSNFEIDIDANLKVDDPAPSIDWANVTEVRRTDAATGQNDDSYKGGVKEDTECPGEVTGSIPNNKSDLLSFGAYVEPEVGGPGFLNLFWSRVADPSGTTLMDFELNQSSTPCTLGPNVVRTAGDLLIEYGIDQGGAVANITVRTWTGSVWGPADDLTGTLAAGTINSSPIPAAESDGLITTGSLSPRTFGEAQLDLDFIFEEGQCDSFGSAMLKSRSSDAFNSQLKDFIRPVPVNITNCGAVIIRKQTDPDEDPNTTLFGYTKSFGTDPSTSNTFSLADDGVKTYNNVLFGTGYTVVEDVIPTGWNFVSLDCSASTGVTPSINGATVTFDINSAADILDCTYTNRLPKGAIVITKTRKHAADGPGDHAHPGVTFTVTGGDLPAAGVTAVTNANGVACVGGLSFSSLVGTYTVTETVPSGYHADGATAKTVSVTTEATCAGGGGDAVSFGNTPLTNITVSVNSQVDGGTASTIDCGAGEVSTGANGDGSTTRNDLEPGTYVCTIVIDP